MSEPYIYYNGHILPHSAVGISPYDRGLTLGDGLFETLRVYGGRPFQQAAHLARLAHGAAILDLLMPSGLDGAIVELVAANGWQEAVVRLTLTRGVGQAGGGLLPPQPAPPPTILITGRDLAAAPPYPAAWYSHGIGLWPGGPPRNEHSPLSGCKTLNYLDQLLVRQAAARQGAEEALQCNTAGAVVGASVANVFIAVGGQVITPSLASGCLPGITRRVAIDLLAARGNPVRETTLTPDNVAAADEVFLTSTLMEILPVTRLADQPIGTGQPGPLTQALMYAFTAAHGT